jgi:hypothetical protein
MRNYIDSGNHKHHPERPAYADGRAGGSVAGSRPENVTAVKLIALSALLHLGNILFMLDKVYKG